MRHISLEDLKNDESPPCICDSVWKKVEELKTKHQACLDKTSTVITEPYHFLTTNSHHHSISKLSLPLFFYELIEIVKTTHLIPLIKNTPLNRMMFGQSQNPEHIKQFVSLYQSGKHDGEISLMLPPYNIIFMDLVGRSDYLQVVEFVSTHQATNGVLILKTSDLFYKQSIAFLHALNTMYGQIIAFRPSISSSITGDIFLICKHKRGSAVQLNEIQRYDKHKWSMFFLNKVEDLVIYFGKKQLENLLANMDALASEKVLPKTLQWCKMLQIPLR